MTETNRIEYKRELTSEIDIEKHTFVNGKQFVYVKFPIVFKQNKDNE